MCLLVSNIMYSYAKKNTEKEMIYNLCACQYAPLHVNAVTRRGLHTPNRVSGVNAPRSFADS